MEISKEPINFSNEINDLYNNIVDNAPVGIATLSIDGHFMQVNQAFTEITGYERSELETMSYQQLTYNEDCAIDDFNIQQLLNNKVKSYRLEKRYIRKDDKIIWVQVTRSIMRNPITKKPLYFIAQIEDVTSRKQAEKALQESENLFRNVIDNAPVGVVTISLDGQLLKVNQAYCHITGYEKEELENMSYKKLTYAEDMTIDTANVQQLLEGKIHSYCLEKRYIRKDDKTIWVQVTRSLLRDSTTGMPSYFIAQVEDISERKQIEKTLRQSKELFQNIVDNAPIGIATVSIDGHFIQVNSSLCKITGYNQEELTKLTYQELTYPEDLSTNFAKVQHLLEGKASSYQIEKRYVRKDGKVIWVQVTRSLLRNQLTGTPLYFIAQVEDISERKTVTEKLQKSMEEIADLYANAPCGYHSLDANDFFTRINNTELNWLGYRADEIIGKMKFSDLLTPASLRIYQENASQFKEQGFLNDVEMELTRRDGSTFTILMSASGNKESGGRYVMNRSTMFNITDRKRTERALLESEERFRNIMDHAPIGMATQSLEGQFLLVNRALCEITGYKKEELEQLTFQKITYPEDLILELENTRKLIEGKNSSYHVEKRQIRKDGTISWIQVTRSILRDTTSGEPIYFILQVEDINERIINREKIYQLAYHDILTGLPNRQLLLDRLNQAIASAKHHHRFMALMFVDLDKFKHVNDTLGHDAGDKLLKEMSARLCCSVRSQDTIARTGGDEFVIILTEISSPQDAAILADKFLKIVKKPLSLQDQQLQITASIGIAIYPNNGLDAAELMKKADMAMYMSKDAGRDRWHFY